MGYEEVNINEVVKDELLSIYVGRIIRIINKEYSERVEAANKLVSYKKIDKQELEKYLLDISVGILEVEFRGVADYIIMLHNHKKEFSKDYDSDVIDFKEIQMPEINQFYQKLILKLGEEVKKRRIEVFPPIEVELMYIKEIKPRKEEYLDLHKRVIHLDNGIEPKSDYAKREFELRKIVHKAKDDMIEEIAKVTYG